MQTYLIFQLNPAIETGKHSDVTIKEIWSMVAARGVEGVVSFVVYRVLKRSLGRVFVEGGMVITMSTLTNSSCDSVFPGEIADRLHLAFDAGDI